MAKDYAMSAMVYDRKGKLLSIGQNSYIKTHPLMAKTGKKVGEEHKIYLHAEVAAIIRIKDWSKAHRIVVTRFNKAGNPVNASPCPICMDIIRRTGIKVIEHT